MTAEHHTLLLEFWIDVGFLAFRNHVLHFRPSDLLMYQDDNANAMFEQGTEGTVAIKATKYIEKGEIIRLACPEPYFCPCHLCDTARSQQPPELNRPASPSSRLRTSPNGAQSDKPQTEERRPESSKTSLPSPKRPMSPSDAPNVNRKINEVRVEQRDSAQDNSTQTNPAEDQGPKDKLSRRQKVKQACKRVPKMFRFKKETPAVVEPQH
ncbi:hypothetical protein CSHISOI_03736 [Colletotrichum shisoi]|uniref:SET domain-containing protein n=1 Tax=Colletotrichum shisoi TaxID=2078593 RepID=A0A5Q4BXF8_9PEZI|nr:hypothetical protein CSHISOI_03736 [Colletotrichum shisoi]